MAPSPRARRALSRFPIAITLISLIFTAEAGADDCFVERGNARFANIGRSSVSGRLVATVQHGGWDTRPMIRIAEIDRFGITEVGRWDASSKVDDVQLVGPTAYVAADWGLATLDLSNPSDPRLLGYIDLGDSQHLTVDGSTAYIATNSGGGGCWLDIIDISDPEAPLRQGNLDWNRPEPFKSEIDAADGIVVMADSLGILVVDVADPWNPLEIGRWEADRAHDVALIGRHALVAHTASNSTHDPGVTVLDLSDPTNPIPVGFWPSPVVSWLSNRSVITVAEYAGSVIAGTKADGLYLLSLDDPSSPITTDHWDSFGDNVFDVSTAWPSVAVSDYVRGLTMLSLDPVCVPPRLPSGRVGRHP